MNFTEAVSSVFSKYATFSGRARRSEFWWFALFNLVASVVCSFIDSAIIGISALGAIYGLLTILPGLAVGCRRLHDIGRSGWWLLIGLIPVVGWIILIVWYVKEGTPGENQFGPAV